MGEMEISGYGIPSLKIGEVTTGNLAEVICLLELVWWDHFPGIISKEQIEYMLSRGYNESAISSELEGGKISWVTLLQNNEIVGVASYGPGDIGAEMRLHKLYLHPCFQRTGYGSAFMQYLREEAIRKGYEYIMLTVNRNNHKAVSAYRRNGFVIVESKLTDIGNGFVMDDYVMRKSLI